MNRGINMENVKHNDTWAKWVLGIMSLLGGCGLILIPASSLSKNEISMVIMGITILLWGQ
jgi:uncharacterized membrane protein